MSGHRKWSEIRGPRTSEQQARVAAGVAATRTILRLAELRAARGLTQNLVSDEMEVSQAHVSQIEHQDDLYLSTLLSYVRALGGELHLRIVFPDNQEFDLPVLGQDQGDTVQAV
jgi:DNA-binding XRE family transcriptional regulator